MTKVRYLAAGVVVLAVAGLLALANPAADAQALPGPTTTTTQPPPPPPPPPPPTLRRGDTNADVQGVQQRLKDLAYDPGAINGAFGAATQVALYAFQKVHGLAPTGEVTPDVRAALAAPSAPAALRPELGPDRVEVDLGRQLMVIYRGGAPALISHISSGNNKRYCVKRRCGVAVTPRGTFAIGRTVRGWETSPLGRLYKSAYFYRGFALHGSLSVPLHAASHGCVRVPMHTAAWFQTLLFRRMPVFVGG